MICSTSRRCSSTRDGSTRRNRPEAVVAAAGVGEDAGEVLDDLVAAAGPAGQLGPQDVHPALQHPAHVGEVGLLLLGLAAAGPQLVEVEVGQVVGEALGQHLVDPAAPVRVGLVGTHRDSPAVTDVRSLTRSSARASSVVIGGRWASRAELGGAVDQLGVAAHRPALGEGQHVLHADPQVAALGQRGERDRQRRAADAGGRPGRTRRAAPRPRRPARRRCRACRRARP